MRTLAVLLLLALMPAVARAQQSPPSNDVPTDSPPPPPLVDAPKADEPQKKLADQGPPTPPPPGYSQQGAQLPYPYSPYGQKPEPPGPEIGLMFTESAFGMLTAAGTSLLSYYLLLKPMGSAIGTGTGDAGTIYNIVFTLSFAAVPMAVSQTQLGLANGSRYYYSESWPSALSGLAAQAAVIGLYYLARPNFRDGGEGVLLVGTIVGVPLVEMAVINLTKTPRWKMPGPSMGSLVKLEDDGTVLAGIPVPMPMPVFDSSGGPSLGMGFSLASGRF